MPKTCPISPSLRPLKLDSIWAHNVSMTSAVVNTSRSSTQMKTKFLPCLRITGQGRCGRCPLGFCVMSDIFYFFFTVASHEVKIMQLTDQHLEPLTCCRLEAIQSLDQLQQSPTVVTQLTRLNNVHNIIQLAILECTFYIKMHCLQVLSYHHQTP